MNAAADFEIEGFDSGSPSRVVREQSDRLCRGVGGPVRFSVEDFIELADRFKQAATMLLIQSSTEANDALVCAFTRYHAMCQQAAETERTR